MFIGFGLLTILYCGCIAMFDTIRIYFQMPPSADEFCLQQQQNSASTDEQTRKTVSVGELIYLHLKSLVD